MNDDTRERITEELLDTVDSFHSVVQRAGGCRIHVDAMKDMSLFHFICHVAAPNGIRFRLIERK